MDAVATAKLALDASGMDRGLQSASASVDKFAKQAGSALAGAFAMNKIIGGFATAIEKGDQLQDLANRFGVSAVSIQEIGNAASLSGAGVEDVASAMNKLSKNAGEAIGGNETMAESFAKIGLSVEDLKTMSPQDLFMSLSKAMASGTIPATEQLAVASDIAGKSVGALMETLRMGPEAISANGQAMGVWSSETILQLSEASDAIKTLQNKFTVGFGVMAQVIMPVIKTLEMLSEQLGFAMASAAELMKGDFKNAMGIAGAATTARKNFGKDTAAPKATTGPIDTEGGPSAKEKLKTEKSAIKDAATAEKDAIKDRTEEAMRILKNEESEKKLANDSYERGRDRARERMLEAANLEVEAAMEKQKTDKEQAGKMAGPSGTSRQFEQTKGGAASEVLGFAGALGDKGISDTVTKERAKAAKEQQKINKEEFDAKVRASTSATAGGGPRTMASRRQEFIKSEAGKEAKGTKTLSDVYSVLDEALKKLTSAPLVGAGA
jgi:hypothetical protein